ncbi:MAG TPA: hypothetical protein VM925_30150 [Labilithrix sp.]|nr:hypothetical protein [Labilithrix sp.]
MRDPLSSRRPVSSGVVLRSIFVIVLLCSSACASLRGRADDALERGDYHSAVALYSTLHARDPSDAHVRERLTRAERGLLDQILDRAETARRGGNDEEAMRIALEVVELKDRMHSGTIDPPRAGRIKQTVDFSTTKLRAAIQAETSRGRALAARARRLALASWLERRDLAALGPELDAEIARAGAATCARATQTASEQPFALELVAAYCKAVGGPMPAWKPRPLLVSGVATAGSIFGTPPNEQIEVERVIAEGVERSVWFTAATDARAAATVQGSVVAAFTKAPTELTKAWTESVPYEATETYQEAIEVPYIDTETYTESVPYTAYEDRLEPCRRGRGTCTVSHPVTRYRDESRTRPVRRVRTEYRDRTRQVTRYRDEPRLFRYPATKHSARYQSTFFVRIDFGGGLRPIEARGSAEDARVAHEHDAEFPPAGVHPEHPTLPSALSWRQQQRERIRDEVRKSLDDGWKHTFCNEGVASIEDAARCARARPQPVPAAVRVRVEQLFGDDPDKILALPRPGEAVH